MKYAFTISMILFCAGLQAQSQGINKDFDREIDDYLSGSVPAIYVEQLLKRDLKTISILDARERKEYLVSTIPHAIHIGYDDFDMEVVSQLEKDDEIIVFCSIGYRSEKIGKKLLKAGFTNVKNLYGSIFAWANAGNPLVTPSGLPTRKLHTYNRKWSKWVENPDIEKVW